jgi:DNA-binding Xre family transcriptional regulator
MKITEERMGFFNMRLVQRMNEIGVSATQLAHSVRLTYEQIRKLIMGRCLPSAPTLERLCASLDLNEHDMKQRVATDRMIFKFGDAAWTFWGINPKAAPLYILFPLLNKDEQDIMRLQLIAFVEAKKKRDRKRRHRAA